MLILKKTLLTSIINSTNNCYIIKNNYVPYKNFIKLIYTILLKLLIFYIKYIHITVYNYKLYCI